MQPINRFDKATRFTGMLICMLSATALLATGAITEGIWQYVMLGSFLIYSGSDIADMGLVARAERAKHEAQVRAERER